MAASVVNFPLPSAPQPQAPPLPGGVPTPDRDSRVLRWSYFLVFAIASAVVAYVQLRSLTVVPAAPAAVAPVINIQWPPVTSAPAAPPAAAGAQAPPARAPGPAASRSRRPPPKPALAVRPISPSSGTGTGILVAYPASPQSTRPLFSEPTPALPDELAIAEVRHNRGIRGPKGTLKLTRSHIIFESDKWEHTLRIPIDQIRGIDKNGFRTSEKPYHFKVPGLDDKRVAQLFALWLTQEWSGLIALASARLNQVSRPSDR